MSQNLGTKGTTSEVMLIWLDQASKYFNMMIIPDVASDNQPVTQPTGGANNQRFSLNEEMIDLESDQMCA